MTARWQRERQECLPAWTVASADGRVRWLERTGRRQGAVRLYWQPSPGSRFWSERGWLSIAIQAMLNTPAGRSPSLASELETRGVAADVSEADFFCNLDLSGGQEDLIRCIPLITGALSERRVTDDALVSAERHVIHERKQHLHHLWGSAEAHRWRAGMQEPRRAGCDYTMPAQPGASRVPLGAGDWPPVDGVVVVGEHELSTAWADAIETLGDYSNASHLSPEPKLGNPPEIATYPARKRGQSLISYGAIDLLDDQSQVFALELAIEFLAGWSGSLLNRLLRLKLAWTYGVGADVRVACIGPRGLLYWSIITQTAPERVPATIAHITEQLRLLLKDLPTDTELRHAGERILRRDLLWENSVEGILQRHASYVQSGLQYLGGGRRDYFRHTAAPSVIRGLKQMLGTGRFVVIDGGYTESQDRGGETIVDP